MDFFHTHISPHAIELATATLRSGHVSEGRMVQQFEAELTQRLGLLQPLALNSGTAALHLALAVAGVGPGDEVILPAQTFVATGLAILMQGARPVFADIQLETGNLDPLSIRAKITERTRAVMPVHWGGYPCDMAEMLALGQEYNLAVIEDAAHALGASYQHQPVGALSRFTAFSFQAIKHLTTGDGGALCCRESADYEQARARRWFGIDRLRDTPSLLGERVYNLHEVGYKYHMNDLAAAVGLGNLADFSGQLQRRREIDRRYRDELKSVAGLQLLERKADRESACWIFTLLVEDREQFVRALQSRGVPASVVHQRIDRNAVFGTLNQTLTRQTEFDARQIAIPLHAGLTDDEVGQVISAVQAGWN